MKRIHKSLLYCLGGVLAIWAVGMLVPRAAHAVIATLVQVVNTPTSPVPTLDNSKSAMFKVELRCPVSPYPPTNDNFACVSLTPQGTSGGRFTVPAGQFLVITTIDEASLATANLADLNLHQFVPPFPGSLVVREGWLLGAIGEGGPTHQLQFPSGIVVGPGYQLLISSGVGINTAYVRGYLTAQ
jgi:hypothetical protein